MIINNQIAKYLRKARILFVKDNCHECAKWKEFIERINLLVPIKKRVRIIDCSNIEVLNILDYQIFKVFDEKMHGSYPFLFFEGNEFDGADTKDRCEAFLKSILHKDFIVPVHNRYRFNKICEYRKIGGKKRLICN